MKGCVGSHEAMATFPVDLGANFFSGLRRVALNRVNRDAALPDGVGDATFTAVPMKPTGVARLSAPAGIEH